MDNKAKLKELEKIRDKIEGKAIKKQIELKEIEKYFNIIENEELIKTGSRELNEARGKGELIFTKLILIDNKAIIEKLIDRESIYKELLAYIEKEKEYCLLNASEKSIPFQELNDFERVISYINSYSKNIPSRIKYSVEAVETDSKVFVRINKILFIYIKPQQLLGRGNILKEEKPEPVDIPFLKRLLMDYDLYLNNPRQSKTRKEVITIIYKENEVINELKKYSAIKEMKEPINAIIYVNAKLMTTLINRKKVKRDLNSYIFDYEKEIKDLNTKMQLIKIIKEVRKEKALKIGDRLQYIERTGNAFVNIETILFICIGWVNENK